MRGRPEGYAVIVTERGIISYKPTISLNSQQIELQMKRPGWPVTVGHITRHLYTLAQQCRKSCRMTLEKTTLLVACEKVTISFVEVGAKRRERRTEINVNLEPACKLPTKMFACICFYHRCLKKGDNFRENDHNSPAIVFSLVACQGRNVWTCSPKFVSTKMVITIIILTIILLIIELMIITTTTITILIIVTII